MTSKNRNAARQQSAKWRLVRKRGGCCEECGGTIAVELHHVIRVADGGTFAEDNLRLLCWPCHQKAHGNEPSEKGLQFHNFIQQPEVTDLHQLSIPGADEHLTTNEAAAKLGISRQRLHILAQSAGITPINQPDQSMKRVHRAYWSRDDILRLDARRSEYLDYLRKALGGPMI